MAVEIHTWKTLEKTYGMIKPDAVRAGKVDAILKAAEDAGFVVVKAQPQQLSRERAGAFYAEHKGKHFYDTLVQDPSPASCALNPKPLTPYPAPSALIPGTLNPGTVNPKPKTLYYEL